MIKKIALLTTLTATLLNADIKEKGFFAGFEVSTAGTDIEYRKKGTVITTSSYDSDDRKMLAGVKVGYQYYYTRVYARANFKSTYHDQEKDRFAYESRLVEINVDYLPVFHTSEDKEWVIRGIFGVGAGVNISNLSSYSKLIDVDSSTADPILDKETQRHMEYGYNIGLCVEYDSGLNLELGYRLRSGLLGEFSSEDKSNQVTFLLDNNREVYLSINYLF